MPFSGVPAPPQDEDDVDIALRRYAEKREAAFERAEPERARPAQVEPLPPFLRGARKPACMAFFASALLIGMHFRSIAASGSFLLKPLAIGVMILPIAVAMFVFPGRVDLPALATKTVPLGQVLAGLDRFERWMWFAATGIGIAAGAYVVVLL